MAVRAKVIVRWPVLLPREVFPGKALAPLIEVPKRLPDSPLDPSPIFDHRRLIGQNLRHY